MSAISNFIMTRNVPLGMLSGRKNDLDIQHCWDLRHSRQTIRTIVALFQGRELFRSPMSQLRIPIGTRATAQGTSYWTQDATPS
jgi:hypothetical protein